MANLVHCIYTSVQTRALAPTEIDDLIRQSRKNNQRHDISGILLHIGRTFFQVLEGPPEKVDALYANILSDPRHTQIVLIIHEPIAKRFFGDSTMSLATLSPREFAAALDEASQEGAEALLNDLGEGRAKRLLRAFAQGRWRARLEVREQEGVSSV